MKLSVMQENLARGLGIVSRAVSSRSTLPVLSNVLLRTEDAGLKLVAAIGLRRVAHHALLLGELLVEEQRIVPDELRLGGFGALGFRFGRGVHACFSSEGCGEA